MAVEDGPVPHLSVSSAAATSTTFKRRERKRQRILNNAESRIQKLLAANTSSDSKYGGRNAPAIEGGEIYRFVKASSDLDSNQECSNEILEFPLHPSIDDSSHRIQSHHAIHSYLSGNEFLLSILIGALMRIFVALSVLSTTIVLPWTIIFVIYQFYLLRTRLLLVSFLLYDFYDTLYGSCPRHIACHMHATRDDPL